MDVNGLNRRSAWKSTAYFWLWFIGCAPSSVEPADDAEEPAEEPPVSGFTETCKDEPELGTELPVWDLYVSQERWQALHKDVYADVEVDAHLCIDGKDYPLELELQGASSRKRIKKSFDLKFKRGPLLDVAPFGVRELLPRIMLKAMHPDQSLVREAIAFDLWRKLGRDAPRTAFTNLRINGKYWGLYAIVEPIDKHYLARRPDLYPASDRLFKGKRREGSFADFAPGRNLQAAFENKSDDDENYSDLERLVSLLQQAPLTAEAYDETIDPIFPLSIYYDRMIWIALTQNSDAISQNFFLYNAPRDDHDFWYVLPWDSNLAFGADWTDPYGIVPTSQNLLVDGGQNHFAQRLVRVPGIRERYLARFRHVMEHVLTKQVVLKVVTHYAKLVTHDLSLDQERWARKITPEEAFAAIEAFVEARPDLLLETIERSYEVAELQ